MALTHTVCGQPVNAFCLKSADASTYQWVALSCDTCDVTVTFGECSGTIDGTTQIYAPTFVAPGAAGTVLTSNGASSAPTWQAPAAAAAAGIIAMEQTIQNGSAGPLTSGVEIQLANPFVNLAAGILNVMKRKMVVEGSGSFTTAVAQIPTLTLYLEVSGIDVISVVTPALTASLSNKMFRFYFEFITLTIGAGATGLVRGSVDIDLAGTGTFTHSESIAFGGSAAVDLTGVWKPKLNVKATGTALNAVVMQDAAYKIYSALV